jgi:diguanylate cyclase (GGDEF)-like protein/PAS domain S-box-containing protein
MSAGSIIRRDGLPRAPADIVPDGGDAAPRRLIGRNGYLAVLGALLVMATIATGAIVIWELRQTALASAERELSNLGVVLAEQTFETIQSVDVVLKDVQTAALALRSPEQFQSYWTAESAHQLLVSHLQNLPQALGITVIDAHGALLNWSRDRGVEKPDLSDRDYFIWLRDHDDPNAFISAPTKSRVNGKEITVIARRINGPEGEFRGVVTGLIDEGYLENFYATIGMVPGESVTLLRRDGMVMAGHPDVENRRGKRMPDQSPWYDSVTMGGGSYRSPGYLADHPQIITVHPIREYPFVVDVNMAVDAALADWHHRTMTVAAASAGVAVGFTILFTVIAVLFRRKDEQHDRVRAAAAALRKSERRLTTFVEMSADWFWEQDANFRFVIDSKIPLTSRSTDVGMTRWELADPAMDESRWVTHKADLEARRPFRDFRWERIQIDGRRRYMSTSGDPLFDDDGKFLGYHGTGRDVSEQRRTEARIAYMAHHDALTGLANRLLFRERLNEAVFRGRRGERCAIMCLDLDHFKSVNDTLGHPVGDALLKEVTQRLLRAVREIDTVARLGGDEFAIVMSGVEHSENITLLAERLIDAIGAPFELDGNRIVVGTSIGIALVPDDGDDPDSIMKNADMALYRAKADGRGRYFFFEQGMDKRMQLRRQLDLDLRQALLEDEFRLFYQPLIDISSRSIVGFEALLRWDHPTRGLVSPADFIPLAEENGFIIPLGEWVLRHACADAATWGGNLKVAVNLSQVQFSSRSLLVDVAAALAASGLNPGRLEVEITETAMFADTEAVLATLHQLRELGVGIALDDFGTGYSSLSYLHRFPFTKVKIDRSFVEDLGQHGGSDTIVAAVVDLCGRLGIATTAEGVETEAQFERLAMTSCTEAQGYLFSRPRPANEVQDMYRALKGGQDTGSTSLAETALPGEV